MDWDYPKRDGFQISRTVIAYKSFYRAQVLGLGWTSFNLRSDSRNILFPISSMGTRRSGTKMTNTSEDSQYLAEYFAGIKKGDFYEEPVEGEYPDW